MGRHTSDLSTSLVQIQGRKGREASSHTLPVGLLDGSSGDDGGESEEREDRGEFHDFVVRLTISWNKRQGVQR